MEYVHFLLRQRLSAHLVSDAQQFPMAQLRACLQALLPSVSHTFQMRVPDPIAEVIQQNLRLALFGSLYASSTMLKVRLHQILNSQEQGLEHQKATHRVP